MFVSENTEQISTKSGIALEFERVSFHIALFQYNSYCHEDFITNFPQTVHRTYQKLSHDV
jgi:hypothetical protein